MACRPEPARALHRGVRLSPGLAAERARSSPRGIGRVTAQVEAGRAPPTRYWARSGGRFTAEGGAGGDQSSVETALDLVTARPAPRPGIVPGGHRSGGGGATNGQISP